LLKLSLFSIWFTAKLFNALKKEYFLYISNTSTNYLLRYILNSNKYFVRYLLSLSFLHVLQNHQYSIIQFLVIYQIIIQKNLKWFFYIVNYKLLLGLIIFNLFQRYLFQNNQQKLCNLSHQGFIVLLIF
jgi:hypothetical protein